MKYFEVHILYLAIPTVFAVRHWWEGADEDGRRLGLQAIGLLVFLAVFWTTPWDNLMVFKDVWTYPHDAVYGHIFYVPVEEYIFFVLQPILTGTLTLWAMRQEPERVPQQPWIRYLSFALLFSLFVPSLFGLDTPSTYYLSVIGAWFLPVVMLQWVVGGDRLWARRESLGLVFFAATVYLCVIDGLAMREEVWSISEATSTGLMVFNVPIEEIAFFAITNLLVIGGVALYVDLRKGWRWS